ncbi:hypothetical protein HK096_011271 [Nowakowskiella sp. JEL0078]|nr:hypothetical protein HK096_011271 [Nowakowskiella sp. JEL0078]
MKSIPKRKIRPAQLIGASDYLQGIEASYFCWRWFKRNNESYRVVTIEMNSTDSTCHLSSSVGPKNLITTADFEDGLGSPVVFNWRWVPRDSQKYRVVTLENLNGPAAKNSLRFGPLDLDGINGYADELKPNFVFCWRWFERDGKKFRFLTIE